MLQAIARVNRLHEGKEFGYIVDYAGVLGELDKALTMYDALEGFDEQDLSGALTSIHEQARRLPQAYSDLWDLFRGVESGHDEEAFEAWLADEERRRDFYERLSDYGKTLAIALSSERFVMETDEAALARYKSDLRRFQHLRQAVKLRYAEAVEYRLYEPRIEKLLHTHIHADEVLQINEPVDIFDDQDFDNVKSGQGVYAKKSAAAKADLIAHAAKRVIRERMEEDPAFYEKFSKLIQQAIDDFRARRVSGQEYLRRASAARNKMAFRDYDDVPESLRDNDEACAYYGVIHPCCASGDQTAAGRADAAASAALAAQEIINKRWKVDFWHDYDAQKAAKNDIDDFLYDEVEGKHGIPLSDGQKDEIIEKTMQIARHRRPA